MLASVTGFPLPSAISNVGVHLAALELRSTVRLMEPSTLMYPVLVAFTVTVTLICLVTFGASKTEV